MFLNIAVAYTGQKEIVDAIKKITSMAKDCKINVDDINESMIESCLYTSHLPQPDPDLVLRTSGEKRLSGFLIWQSAYSRTSLYGRILAGIQEDDLMRAIRTYQRRIRRFGK